MKFGKIRLTFLLFSLTYQSWAQEYDKLWLRYEALFTEKATKLKPYFEEI